MFSYWCFGIFCESYTTKLGINHFNVHMHLKTFAVKLQCEINEQLFLCSYKIRVFFFVDFLDVLVCFVIDFDLKTESYDRHLKQTDIAAEKFK